MAESLHFGYRAVNALLIAAAAVVAHTVQEGLLSWLLPVVLGLAIGLVGELTGASVQKTLAARARRARIEREHARIVRDDVRP